MAWGKMAMVFVARASVYLFFHGYFQCFLSPALLMSRQRQRQRQRQQQQQQQQQWDCALMSAHSSTHVGAVSKRL